MAAVELDPTNHADWITIARKWANGVCRDNHHWDADDLEGYILLDMVRWPSDTVAGLWGRAKSATVGWHRERLGRGTAEKPHGKGQMLARMQYLDEERSAPGIQGKIPLHELVPDGQHMEDDAITAVLTEWMPLAFTGRDSIILRRIIDGYKLHEIGQELGVTESRVSQLLNGRIRPKVARMLMISKGGDEDDREVHDSTGSWGGSATASPSGFDYDDGALVGLPAWCSGIDLDGTAHGAA